MEGIMFYFTLFLASLLLTKLLFFSKKNRNNSLPPSPPSLPIVGHLHLIKKPVHRSLASLSGRYGPLLLLRFGSRPVLVVSSHSLAEECFTKNDAAFASRPRLPSCSRVTYNQTTLAMSPYGPHWRNLRRIAAVELFSSARLHSLSELRLDEAHCFVSNLFRECYCNHKSYDRFKKLELKPRLFRLTLNMMMRTIAGKRYYRYEAKDSEEADRLREVVEETLALLRSHVSDFLPVLKWVDFRGTTKRRIDKVEAAREEILQGLIDEQRRTGGGHCEEERKKKTILEVMLSLQKENPDYYTDDTIKALILVSLSPP